MTRMKTAVLVMMSAIMFGCSSDLFAIGFGKRYSIHGFENGYTISADLYKSYISSFIYLTRRSSTPMFQSSDEVAIYQYLLQRSLGPRYLLAQATFYPVAAISSHLESYEFGQYQRFNFYGSNLIRMIGSGPQEPYALSLFLGNLCLLGYKLETDRTSNRLIPFGSALGGFLISFGHRHILDNIILHDRWWQLEYILTGTSGEGQRQKMAWNFRTGVKIHREHLAPDVWIVAMQRDHTDYDWHALSLFKNSRIAYEIHVATAMRLEGVRLNRQMFSYGKKIPFQYRSRDIVLRIGAGVLWEDVVQFNHEKQSFDDTRDSNLTFLFQPGIEL